MPTGSRDVFWCESILSSRQNGDSAGISAPQLKIMQEALTLLVFIFFAAWYLGEPLKWNHYVAFLLVAGAVFFVFHKW